MEKNVEELARRNLPHLVLNPANLSDIPADIRLVGRAAGCERKAEAVAEHFTRSVESIRSATARVQRRPKLFWEWWPNPIYTPGRDNWLTDVSEIAGAVNVFAEFPTDNVKATREMVMERDPEHICVVWCGVPLKRIKREMITERPEWRQVTAIQAGNVHLLEEGLYCRPSPRILSGLRQLVELIHPGLI